MKTDPDLNIIIESDGKKKTITIKDNGIGMNRDEVMSRTWERLLNPALRNSWRV